MLKNSRLRTIEGAYKEIVAADPGTAVSKHMVRKAVVDGAIPSQRVGAKYIFDLDALLEYFGGAK